MKERTTATILKDNVKDVLTRHSGPYRTPFADYLSRSVTLVCDSHADFDPLFGLLQTLALAIAKNFSRGSASIEIAAEFFWVSVMVVFMVACGLQKYTPCCKGLRLRI